MALRSLLVAALVLVTSVVPTVGADGEKPGSLPSPDGHYILKIEPKDVGRDLYLVSVKDQKNKVLIESSDRWMDFRWAPNSKYCVVENHSDGHITSLKVFKIYGLGSKGEIVWEQVYQSPSPLRYDSFWTLLKWDLKAGTVRLHCRYREEEGNVVGTGKWVERDFEVPIDLVPPP